MYVKVSIDLSLDLICFFEEPCLVVTVFGQ